MPRIVIHLIWVVSFLAALVSSPARADGGYWKFEGYDLSPGQAQLDETSRGTPPGRVWEARVTGAFQADYAGKGSLDLFFKYDDVDRHVYTTKVTYLFSADRQMKVLVPGEKLVLTGALSIDGSDPQSSASGSAWVNNGDNLFYIETPRRQQKSAESSFVVPGGGANDTMRVSATGGLYGVGGALHETITITYSWVDGPPPRLDDQTSSQPPGGGQDEASSAPDVTGESVPGGEILGPTMVVTEPGGWSGTWTRRPGTDTYDASWNGPAGSTASDVLTLVLVVDRSVVLTRAGNAGVYFGTVSADGQSVMGTASWYEAGQIWSGVFEGETSVIGPPPDDSPQINVAPNDTASSPDDVPTESAPLTKFVDNWNGDACGLTDTAVLKVGKATHLAKFDLWIKWPDGRTSLPYNVFLEGTDIGGGKLIRGACDPYQPAWCAGTDEPDVDLPKGAYKIHVDTALLCQNAASGHTGFIRAWHQ